MKKFTAFAAVILMCLCLVGCTSKSERYTDYIRAVLNCSYYGKTQEYARLTDSTAEEAEQVYQDELDYVTELICYRFAVEPSCISNETQAGYEELAKKVMDKTKFTVEPAVKSGDAYHVTINCEPIDFWDIAIEDVETYYVEEFGSKYEAAGTTAERNLLEEEYAVNVLEILNQYVDKIGHTDSVKKIVEITVDEKGKEGIADQDWVDIDTLILGGKYTVQE